MYIGYETKWACTPLIVMLVAARTAWRFSEVIVPVWVVIAVSKPTVLPPNVPLPVPP